MGKKEFHEAKIKLNINYSSCPFVLNLREKYIWSTMYEEKKLPLLLIISLVTVTFVKINQNK